MTVGRDIDGEFDLFGHLMHEGRLVCIVFKVSLFCLIRDKISRYRDIVSQVVHFEFVL